MLTKEQRQEIRRNSDMAWGIFKVPEGHVPADGLLIATMMGMAKEKLVPVVQCLLDDLDAKDAEIARITALNTQQAVKMTHLTILALGCKEHSSYRAKRKIMTWCETCNRMWEASQALKEMGKDD